jgi:hypothetical protein
MAKTVQKPSIPAILFLRAFLATELFSAAVCLEGDRIVG